MHPTELTPLELQKYAGARRKMIEEQLASRGIKDFRLMEAMSRIPRHLFVPDSLQHKAYGDHPLPIGDGQTISQPYVVAKMTEALNLKGREWVLEIGTGSGYQTAVLAEMAEKVFTIERIQSLARQAVRRLDQLGYQNINYKQFDGSYGWRDRGPFDAIVLTASPPELPRSLIDQLKEGGRLIAPVGADNKQQLTMWTKTGTRMNPKLLGDCTFVKLIGKYGWSEDE